MIQTLVGTSDANFYENLPSDYGERLLIVAYLSSAPRMCKVIRQVSKPCLGFKILVAGRKCTSAESVRAAFKFAYENVKPTDVVIVGMFRKYKRPNHGERCVRTGICRVAGRG